MVRGLAGRARTSPRQSLQDQEGSRRLHRPNAAARRKKRPEGGSARAVVEAWLAPRSQHKNYRQAAGDIIAATAGLAAHQVNRDIALGIFTRWKARYAHNTLYAWAGILRRVLKEMQSAGAPAIQLPHVSGPRARPNIATPEQLSQLVATAAPWLRLFILLCWQTALRFSEAYAVTPRSYDAKTKTVSITTKGGKHRVIPIPPDVEKLIAPTLEGDPDISCIALLKGGRCSPGAVRSAWCALTNKLGIKNVNPHDLRRTTATHLYRTTHDLRAVQQYLGHDGLLSTVRYLAPLSEEQLREYQQLLRFQGGKPQ